MKNAREILYGRNEDIGIDDIIEIIKISSKILKTIKDKELIIRALQFCLNNKDSDKSNSNQIIHFLKKLDSDERPQIRSFIISEIEEVLSMAGVGVITSQQLERYKYDKAFKATLSTNGREIKNKLEQLLTEKFGDKFQDKVAKKINRDPYGLTRFLREERTPSIMFLERLFTVLNISELRYVKGKTSN